MFKLINNESLENYTLILPSVSVGNVPQLAADLLISTFELIKIGIVWHPAIIPSVGGDPFKESSGDVCTACELYANKDLKLAVLQLRSGLDPKLTKKFLLDLKTCIIDNKFGNAFILTSAFDYELHHVDREKQFYISTKGTDEKLEELNFKVRQDSSLQCNIPGGGFASYLYEILKDKTSSKVFSSDCTLLYKYVSEGDNRPEAVSFVVLLIKYLDNFKDVKNVQIKYPISWSLLFGGPPPNSIY